MTELRYKLQKLVSYITFKYPYASYIVLIHVSQKLMLQDFDIIIVVQEMYNIVLAITVIN